MSPRNEIVKKIRIIREIHVFRALCIPKEHVPHLPFLLGSTPKGGATRESPTTHAYPSSKYV